MDQLIRRSLELENELRDFMGLRPISADPRSVSARVMLDLSFEHGRGIRLLIAEDRLASAFGLVRLQYEALVRGVWLMTAASDEQVAHICRDLTNESIDRLPMIADMLKSMAGTAPPGILATLQDFRVTSLKPLNSFVHSGAHALQRGFGGYPESLVSQVMVASNGLQFLSVFQVVSMAQEANAAVRIHGIELTYADCLPQHAV